MTYTVDILFYLDGKYDFYIRYKDVPEWKKRAMVKKKTDGNWKLKVFVDGEEVSE